MNLAGLPRHHEQALNSEYSAPSPSLEKEDTVEGRLCRSLYIPKFKQEVEAGDVGS